MGPIVYNVSLLINGGPADPQRLPSYVGSLGGVDGFVSKTMQRAAFARILLCGFDDALEVGAARIYRESRQAGFSTVESAFAVGLMADVVLQRPYG